MRGLELNATVGLLLAVLLAVPTITPNRRIVVQVQPVMVPVDMAVVTSQDKGGPVKVNVTPIQRSKKKD